MVGKAKMRVLFVDDEAMVLQMLRLATAAQRNEWETAFAQSGTEALELMAKQPFDVVVSDMRMPGMSGAQLLNETLRLHPATFRIILTGFVEQDEASKCIGSTHQFLSKPFELQTLRGVLSRANRVRELLRRHEVRTLVARNGSLPSIPELYFKILEALQAPDCPVERIAEIVKTDPAMTAKMLQLVNSAFFGFARQVANAEEAVMLLGTGRIRSLALTLHLFSVFDFDPKDGFSIEQIWNHSLRVAQMAERIARQEEANEVVVDQAFTAGLLHDLGMLMLANDAQFNYTETLGRARRENRLLEDLEREVYQGSHAEIGAALLDLWSLPLGLVEAVLWHSAPSGAQQTSFSAVTAVSIANFLAQEANPESSWGPPCGLDIASLERLGLQERVEVWREAVRGL
jgi:HD-like signal output (HDOD) protein/ActR/RegA family two-component response regulator